MTISTINPTTEALIKEYEEMPPQEVATLINSTHEAFLAWRHTSFEVRRLHMNKLSEILKTKQREFAEKITEEMGKPITQSVAEVAKCISLCDYYHEFAEAFLSPRLIETDYHKSMVTYQPQGIVFAIMPWNFPLWQVLRFLVPCLMAGNGGLLSHAPISTGLSLMIEALVLEAGFPKNLFRSLIIDNEGAAKVINNPHVTGVTLTGSERAGMAVASEAGKALKKVVLELGGSDPYLILEDADLEHAAEMCITSRLNNSGQVCISAKRIIVMPSIRRKFEGLILEKMKRYKMGNPTDSNTNFGPIARRDIRDEIHSQVLACVEKGADLITGGEIPDRRGFYYPPTLLTNVQAGTPAYDAEIFGPVVALLDAANLNEAIRIANSSPYGLGAAVFTEDLKKGEEIATHHLNAGTCCVNTFVASNPRLPFGGIKNSGYGRELSQEGIHEFVNVKTVCIK
jgi:succinate-semialdehyde dehydrogenase/glutarate-semialdehyde dehydrogenase